MKTLVVVALVLVLLGQVECVPSNYTDIEAQRIVGVRFFSTLNAFLCDNFSDLFEPGAEISLPLNLTFSPSEFCATLFLSYSSFFIQTKETDIIVDGNNNVVFNTPFRGTYRLSEGSPCIVEFNGFTVLRITGEFPQYKISSTEMFYSGNIVDAEVNC